MSGSSSAARQLDDFLDHGAEADLVDDSVLEAARLLQLDAQIDEPMPHAREVRLRVLEAIVDEQVVELGRREQRIARRQRRSIGRRLVANAGVLLAICGVSAAVAQTNTPPGDAVRGAVQTATSTFQRLDPRTDPAPARNDRDANRPAAAQPNSDPTVAPPGTPAREGVEPTKQSAETEVGVGTDVPIDVVGAQPIDGQPAPNLGQPAGQQPVHQPQPGGNQPPPQGGTVQQPQPPKPNPGPNPGPNGGQPQPQQPVPSGGWKPPVQPAPAQ